MWRDPVSLDYAVDSEGTPFGVTSSTSPHVGPGPARDVRTVGVEEEFLLVGADGVTAGVAPRVLGPDDGDSLTAQADGEVGAELNREQLETGSAPHTSLSALRESLVELRRAAAEAALAEGAALAATATSPIPAEPTVTAKGRYERMRAEFGLTAREQLTCGCHVHVAVSSPSEAIGALDRARPDLALLVALSANSPFWHGEDTGYASYRTQIWQRWPTAGATGAFGTPECYEQVVADLIASGAALDEGMIYFDARPAAQTSAGRRARTTLRPARSAPVLRRRPRP